MSRLAVTAAGVVVAGAGAALTSAVVSTPGLAVVVGLALAVPFLRPALVETPSGGYDWVLATIAVVGGLAVGAIAALVANAAVTSEAIVAGLGAGGVYAGSYLADAYGYYAA